MAHDRAGKTQICATYLPTYLPTSFDIMPAPDHNYLSRFFFLFHHSILLYWLFAWESSGDVGRLGHPGGMLPAAREKGFNLSSSTRGTTYMLCEGPGIRVRMYTCSDKFVNIRLFPCGIGLQQICTSGWSLYSSGENKYCRYIARKCSPAKYFCCMPFAF